MKHINVSLFVVNNGCPYRCSFCDQTQISGNTYLPSADDVKKACEIAIKSGKTSSESSEIAFFGGSFTCMEKAYMIELLEAAQEYIGEYFKGIRISTRPDAIDKEILTILKKYGVSSIELGAQSLDDEVLKRNFRGHNSKHVEEASKLIKKIGISLGLQMMTGLPFDTNEKTINTAKKIIDISPETVRIYPLIVLKNTLCGKWYLDGKFKPQMLSEAVKLCSELILMFEKENIKVIRVGLHSGGNIEGGYLAGAYHPAFRELCENEIFYRIVKNEISNKSKDQEYVVYTAETSLSKARGQRNSNILRLAKNGYNVTIKPKNGLVNRQIEIMESGSL